MLASTVQFSRYGRSRNAQRRIRGEGVPVLEGTAFARSFRTQQRARPDRHRRHPSVPEDVLTDFADELTK
jgi:hypothetical protein